MRTEIDSARGDLPVPSVKREGDIAKPPHPLDRQWYMNVDDQTFGPYSGHELKAFADEGRLERDSQVNKVGTPTWIAAGEDAALSRFFVQTAKPPLSASRIERAGSANAGDNGTVVQVTNNIHAPNPVFDPGADKSPGLALFLSLIIVGLGQIYNGDVLKGILMFIGCLLLWAVFLGWIINIWSMIDAYSRAKELRLKHQMWMANLRTA